MESNCIYCKAKMVYERNFVPTKFCSQDCHDKYWEERKARGEAGEKEWKAENDRFTTQRKTLRFKLKHFILWPYYQYNVWWMQREFRRRQQK